jgi:hypothetical protein
VVGLCDGETSIEVPWLKPGQRMTREQARGVSEALMVKWRARHPDAEWQVAQAQTSQPGAPQSTAQQGQSGAPAPAAPIQGGVYERLTPREQKIADIETAKFTEVGKEIFHNSEELGGTIGVSCDMCHPDAANTHPETYPKYRTQLQFGAATTRSTGASKTRSRVSRSAPTTSACARSRLIPAAMFPLAQTLCIPSANYRAAPERFVALKRWADKRQPGPVAGWTRGNSGKPSPPICVGCGTPKASRSEPPLASSVPAQ